MDLGFPSGPRSVALPDVYLMIWAFWILIGLLILSGINRKG